MIVAGVDSGTTSGIAIFDGTRLLHAESHRPKGDTDAAIFHGLRVWLRPLLADAGVEYLALEQPLRTDLSAPDDDVAVLAKGLRAKKPIGNMRTFLRLYGIRAHILELCEALSIESVEVNNRSWRSAIYGSTVRPPKSVKNRSEWWKQQALQHAKIVGWNITSKDAAEAAAICDWCARCHLQIAQLSRPGELFAPNTENAA